jgi:DNA repair protein RadA/Sms
VNVSGGFRIQEPGCDLAVAAAIWSSLGGLTLPEDRAYIGELSLTGEVRPVSQIDSRVEEAKKLGFKSAVVPRQSMDRLKSASKALQGIQLIPIGRISDLKLTGSPARQLDANA